ncbi:hypothetical protein [Amycolatopsis sp. cmx-11-12]|uniref:hypothetical protein n=1 Tax=Amycolatopsis sp. cmx-11-12 TaxID=2785795 RepID=UPI00391809E3
MTMALDVAQNDILLAMMDGLVGEKADLEATQIAFETTRGDFTARFRAAVQAGFAQLVRAEVFIEIPENPERLSKDELDALVRPAAEGFLRSYPTKGELLEQVERIRRRQERRPAWIPRIDRDGNPLPSESQPDREADQFARQPKAVTGFPELGPVSVEVLAGYEDRPELVMAAGGLGELEMVLHTVLGTARNDDPRNVIRIDAQSNEALVPPAARWWSQDALQGLPAAEDVGVASELLATSPTVGNHAVEEATQAGLLTAIDALAAAGDWRFSPLWRLDTWGSGHDAMTSAAARAALAGWAEGKRSGLIVYVHGGAFHAHEGTYGDPGPLHSYLMCVSRTAATRDGFDAVHRLMLSCPGEDWCHRGGCDVEPCLELEALLRSVVTSGIAADQVRAEGNKDHQQLYGGGDDVGYTGTVLEAAAARLVACGWADLGRSEWEGGIEEACFRRGEHCLTVAYDPLTRQLQLADGGSELDLTLQMLAEDGFLTGEEGAETIDVGAAAAQGWSTEILDAAEEGLRGRISSLPGLDSAVRITLLGLHPHADGSLRGPGSSGLIDVQLTAFLSSVGVLKSVE